jgi:hypothetical protein
MKIKLIKDCNLGQEVGHKNEVIEVSESTGKKLIKLNLAFEITEEQLELPLEQEEVVVQAEEQPVEAQEETVEVEIEVEEPVVEEKVSKKGKK